MSAPSEALHEELPALPVDERSGLSAELLDSLDDEHSLDDPVDGALGWSNELLRRSEPISSGAVVTVGWDQVLERVADSRRPR